MSDDAARRIAVGDEMENDAAAFADARERAERGEHVEASEEESPLTAASAPRPCSRTRAGPCSPA